MRRAIIYCLMLLTVCGGGFAAEPTNPISQGLIGNPTLQYGKLPAGVSARADHWAVWKYSGKVYGYVFSPDEVLPFVTAWLKNASSDEPAAEAYCQAHCTSMTVAEAAFIRKKFIKHLGVQAKTVSRLAYSRSISGTAAAPVITFRAVGVVNFDVPCTPIDDTYCTLPQSAVSPTVPTIPLPLPVYGVY